MDSTEPPCWQGVHLLSQICSFLVITRKPSFQSSWNRKLPNFDFWIFLKVFLSKKYFFLVKIYKISDFTATVVSIWAIIRYFFFHYLKKKDFGFSITKKHWKDNYYIIIYKYTKKFFENFIFLLTKYSKIIYSCYFAILSMSFFPIEK